MLANAGIIELSTYSTNLLTLLVIAAGTDYAIFLLGRYHEARYAGQDRVSAYNTMYHGTAHIILGSGLTIAGAVLCLTFTRLPYFQQPGHPCRHRRPRRGRGGADPGAGAADHRPPFRAVRTRRARCAPGAGGASARRSCAGPAPSWSRRSRIALIGLLALPGYKTSYDARPTCRPAPRPTSDTRRPNATSRRPGSIPNC